MESTLGLVASSGWASGLNLYAVLLLLGVAGRTGFADVPEVLARTDVLVVAGVLYGVEFLADKVPYLDNVWDALHTVVRPIGATALGAVLAGEVGSVEQGVNAALSGGLALAGHAAKATTRLAVNTSPEPASNVVVSLLEDGLVAGLVVLAIAYPWVALGVTLVLLVAGSVLTVWLLRAAGRGLRRLRERRAALR